MSDNDENANTEDTQSPGSQFAYIATFMSSIDDRLKGLSLEMTSVRTRLSNLESQQSQPQPETTYSEELRLTIDQVSRLASRLSTVSDNCDNRIDSIKQEFDGRFASISAEVKSLKDLFRLAHESDRGNANLHPKANPEMMTNVNPQEPPVQSQTDVKQPFNQSQPNRANTKAGLDDLLFGIDRPVDQHISVNDNVPRTENQTGQSNPPHRSHNETEANTSQIILEQIQKAFGTKSKVPLPKFDGKDPNAWIWNYKLVANHSGLSEEEMCRRIITCLEGEANHWFLTNFKSRLEQFSEFENKFRERFDCEDTPSAVYRRISTAKQQPGQSGIDFIEEMHRYNDDLEKKFSEDELFDFISDGLDEDYACRVLTCDNLEQATKVIRKLDRHYAQLKKGNQPVVKNDSHRKGSYNCYNCRQPGHLAYECPNGSSHSQRSGHNVPIAQPTSRGLLRSRDDYDLRNRQPINYNEKQNPNHNKPFPVQELSTATSNETPVASVPQSCEPDPDMTNEIDMSKVWLMGSQNSSPPANAKIDSITSFSITKEEVEVPQVVMGDLPIVSLKIGAYEARGLIDTGAVLTAIDSKLATLLSHDWFAWNGPELKMADGRPVQPMGVIWTEMEFRGKIVRMPVAIVENMGINAIFGTNFLEAMDLVIMTGRQRILFYEELNIKSDMNGLISTGNIGKYDVVRSPTV